MLDVTVQMVIARSRIIQNYQASTRLICSRHSKHIVTVPAPTQSWPVWLQLYQMKISPISLLIFQQQTPSTGAVEADLVARGQQLYRFGDSEKGISACAACHGPTGAGVASAVFPSLKGQWAAYSETQLKAYRDGQRQHVMMNGVAKNMSDADIKAVASYVGGLQ